MMDYDALCAERDGLRKGRRLARDRARQLHRGHQPVCNVLRHRRRPHIGPGRGDDPPRRARQRVRLDRRHRAGPGHGDRRRPGRGDRDGGSHRAGQGDLGRYRAHALWRAAPGASRAAGIGGEAIAQSGKALRAQILERRRRPCSRPRRRASTSGTGVVVDRETGAERIGLDEIGPHLLFPPRYPAAGLPGRAGRDPPLRAQGLPLRLHQRGAGRLCRDRRRDRVPQAAEPLVRRGLRHRHQPADGRRADPRRHRPGARRGALGALRLRRGGPAPERHHGGLSGAAVERALRHRVRPRGLDDRLVRARRQGGRRGRHLRRARRW